MKLAHILILITVLCTTFFGACSLLSPSRLNTTSPNKTYSVYMQEHEESSSNYLTRFSVESKHRTLIKDETFSSNSGRFIDSDLTYNWTAENILRFGLFDSSLASNEISITNQTNKVIRYLKVYAENEFLLFDVQPQTTTRLFVNSFSEKGTLLNSVSIIGKYNDGVKVSPGNMTFRIVGNFTSPIHYCVSISDEQTIIQSREFAGYQTGMPEELAEIPEARNPFCP